MLIASRTHAGSVCCCLAWRVRCAHEQLLILHARIGSCAVGPWAVCTLLRRSVRVVSVGGIITSIEAWVSAQKAGLIHVSRICSTLWYPYCRRGWLIAVLGWTLITSVMISHVGLDAGCASMGSELSRLEWGHGCRATEGDVDVVGVALVPVCVV